MTEGDFPQLLILKPTAAFDVCVALDFVCDFILLTYPLEILNNLMARREERGPARVRRKREAVEDGRSARALRRDFLSYCVNIHIASHAWILVNPPRPTYAGLPFEDAELVEAEYFFETGAHGDAGLTGADDDDGIVGVGILFVAANVADSLPMGHGGGQEWQC